MKLSFAVLSLAVACTEGTSLLRATVVKNNLSTLSSLNNNANILASEIILKGAIGEPSADDMDFIGKALVASYNNVHWEVGHYMTGGHSVDYAGPDVSVMCRMCPDDDSMGGAATAGVFSVKTPVGVMCRMCPDDDAMGTDSLLMTAIVDDCAGLCNEDAAAELEVNFCNKIRSAQGSKYLKSAESCSIRFDSEAEKNDNKKEIAAVASINQNTSSDNVVSIIDSTLILKGVAGDATSKVDQAIIAKAFVSAYNDVHWDADHYLADAEIPFAAGTPDPETVMCRMCPDDDSMGGAVTKTLVLDVVTPVVGVMCRMCPDDDSMGSQFDLERLNTSEDNKKAVEAAFCEKLQNSVSDKLSVTKSCSIAVQAAAVREADDIGAAAKVW